MAPTLALRLCIVFAVVLIVSWNTSCTAARSRKNMGTDVRNLTLFPTPLKQSNLREFHHGHGIVIYLHNMKTGGSTICQLAIFSNMRTNKKKANNCRLGNAQMTPYLRHLATTGEPPSTINSNFIAFEPGFTNKMPLPTNDAWIAEVPFHQFDSPFWTSINLLVSFRDPLERLWSYVTQSFVAKKIPFATEDVPLMVRELNLACSYGTLQEYHHVTEYKFPRGPWISVTPDRFWQNTHNIMTWLLAGNASDLGTAAFHLQQHVSVVVALSERPEMTMFLLENTLGFKDTNASDHSSRFTGHSLATDLADNLDANVAAQFKAANENDYCLYELAMNLMADHARSLGWTERIERVDVGLRCTEKIRTAQQKLAGNVASPPCEDEAKLLDDMQQAEDLFVSLKTLSTTTQEGNDAHLHPPQHRLPSETR